MIAVPSPAQPAAAGGQTAARPAIRVTGLEPAAAYCAKVMNPVSGKITDLGSFTPDDKSGWTANPPVQSDADDWVLILERQP